MINLDSITNQYNKVLIIGRSGSGKTNTLLNLIKEQDKDDVID